MKNIKLALITGCLSIITCHGFAADEVVLQCNSSHQNIDIEFKVTDKMAQLNVTTADKKTFKCESKPEFINGIKAINPFYRVSMDLMGKCKPILSASMAKKLNSVVVFDQDLMGNKNLISWVAFSAPLPCELKTNNLEKHMKTLPAPKTRNR